MDKKEQLVEDLSNLDPVKGYALLTDYFGGDEELIEEFLDEMIDVEGQTLSEAEEVINFGSVFLVIGASLEPTKEARAAETQHNWYKELYFVKGNKEEAVEKFYSKHPDLAELDGVAVE